jgi:flagellum-specific peptidoglycan hydrolase FlgJ
MSEQDTYTADNTGSADSGSARKTANERRAANRQTNNATVKGIESESTRNTPEIFNPNNESSSTSATDTSEPSAKSGTGTTPFRNNININQTGGGAATSIQKPMSTPTPGSLRDRATSQPFEGSQKQFYDKMYATLLSEATKQGVQNPEAIARVGTAQSVIETGYGKHLAGGNNYFGIKARPGEGGPAQQTQEFINGKMVTINDKFRRYNSMEESAADYVKFLKENSRYKETLAAKTVDEAILAIGRSGYATDPGYANKLKSVNGSGMAGNLPGTSATSVIREGRGVGPGHDGIDIAAPIGTPVQATSPGKVIQASFEPKGYSGYGNIVVIESLSGNGEKIYTKYAHLSAFDVKVGDTVDQGGKIGKIGNTGRSSGPHLHYEMRKGDPVVGTVIDPKKLSLISPMDSALKQTPGAPATAGLKGQQRQTATSASQPYAPQQNNNQNNPQTAAVYNRYVAQILLGSLINGSGYGLG